jgi:hypothetical protein
MAFKRRPQIYECCICGVANKPFDLKNGFISKEAFVGYSRLLSIVCNDCWKNKDAIFSEIRQCALCKKYFSESLVIKDFLHGCLFADRKRGQPLFFYKRYPAVCKKCNIHIQNVEDGFLDYMENKKLINRIKRLSCEKSKQLAS